MFFPICIVKGYCVPKDGDTSSSETSEEVLARLPAWIRILRQLERQARGDMNSRSENRGEDCAPNSGSRRGDRN